MTPTPIAAAVAALVLASLSVPAAAEAPGTVKMTLAAEPASGAAQPLAVLLDQPTGATFIYLPEEGWKFAGRNEAAVDAEPPRSGQPVSLFVDGPTGFVYTYAVEAGWKFAGRVDGLQ